LPLSGRVNEGTNSFAVARISPWRGVAENETAEGFSGRGVTGGLVGGAEGWVALGVKPGGGTDG